MDSERIRNDYTHFTFSESSTSNSIRPETAPVLVSRKTKLCSPAAGYFNGPRPDLASFIRIPEFSGFGMDNSPIQTLFKNNQEFNSMCEASGGDRNEHLNEKIKLNKSIENVSYEPSCPIIYRTSSDENHITPEYKSGRGKPQSLGILPILNFGKLRKDAESENNVLVSAVKLATHIFKAGWQLVTVFFSEDVQPNEDVVKFNGYTIRTYGAAVGLDSMHFNKNQWKLNVKLNKALDHGSEPKVFFEDSKWEMIFGHTNNEGFIEVIVPLGVNTAEIKYEGPVDGLIIIDSP